MSSGSVLSLLGLALRGGRLAVGEEPVSLAAKAGQVRLILLAADAAVNTLRRAEHLAEEGRCLCLVLPFSKAELGGALGRGSAAVAALKDLGLAAAVTERLAALDPEHYGEAAARMDLKRRRAKERQSAPHRAPPKKAPFPRREDRRPPSAHREGGSAPRDRQKPAGQFRSDRPRQERSYDGEHSRRAAGKGRPYGKGPDRPQDGRHPQTGKHGRPSHGKPAVDRPQGGKPGRPPWSKGKPRSNGPTGGKGGGR